MALRRKGSAPWSLTKETGLSDAPVSGSPFVEGDEVKPVIDAGFIDEKGLWQINRASNDGAFTFQDPSQALAAGANLFVDLNMLKHDIVIFAVSDTSGNAINVDLTYRLPATPTGPYNNPIFTGSPGIAGGESWTTNKGTGDGTFYELMRDTSTPLEANWQFYKIANLFGTVGTIEIHNNDGSNAGTISTAYMRLV